MRVRTSVCRLKWISGQLIPTYSLILISLCREFINVIINRENEKSNKSETFSYKGTTSSERLIFTLVNRLVSNGLEAGITQVSVTLSTVQSAKEVSKHDSLIIIYLQQIGRSRVFSVRNNR